MCAPERVGCEHGRLLQAFDKLRVVRLEHGSRKCVASLGGRRTKRAVLSQLSTLARSWQTASKAVILDSRISSSCVVCSALTIARALSASASFGAPFNRSVTILGRGFRLLSLLREREKDIMEQFRRSSDSTSSDLIPFAVAIHAILNGLAVKIRSQNNRGAQIENGETKSRNLYEAGT